MASLLLPGRLPWAAQPTSFRPWAFPRPQFLYFQLPVPSLSVPGTEKCLNLRSWHEASLEAGILSPREMSRFCWGMAHLSANHMFSQKTCCSCSSLPLCAIGLSPVLADVFICGGYNGEVILGDIWKLNLQTFQWVKLPAIMPEPVYFHCAAVTPVSLFLHRSYIVGRKEYEQGEKMLLLTNCGLRKGEENTTPSRLKKAL